jgi:hypothetical protein
VQVETDHDRNRGADDFAYASQQLAFAILVMLGNHRAVQIEVYRVQRLSIAQPGTDQVGHPLERVARDVTARFGGAPAKRQQLVPLLPRAFDKAGERDVEPLHDVDQFLPDAQTGPAIRALEILERRQVGRKSIGFVLKAADRNRIGNHHEN